MANQKRRANPRTKAKADANREPLQELAEQLGIGLDDVKKVVQTTASAQMVVAKRRAKLLQYQAAAKECMRAYQAIDGNEQGALFIGRLLGITENERRSDHPPWKPVKRPWLLAQIDASEGPLAGDNEDREAVERRILLELGASPNAIAAFHDLNQKNSPLRAYSDSAEARGARRDASRLRERLRTEISNLKKRRAAFHDDTTDEIAKLLLAPQLPALDEEIADREDSLARLNARRPNARRRS